MKIIILFVYVCLHYYTYAAHAIWWFVLSSPIRLGPGSKLGQGMYLSLIGENRASPYPRRCVSRRKPYTFSP